MGNNRKKPEEVKKPAVDTRTNSERTDAENKRIKQAKFALARPEQAAENKEKSDAKRERRKESGSVKQLG